jgi:hypothetical protein
MMELHLHFPMCLHRQPYRFCESEMQSVLYISTYVSLPRFLYSTTGISVQCLAVFRVSSVCLSLQCVRLPFSSWHICLFRLYLILHLFFQSPASHSFFSRSLLFCCSIAVSVSSSRPSQFCLHPFLFLAVLHVPEHESRIFGLSILFHVSSPSVETVTDAGFRSAQPWDCKRCSTVLR